MNEHSRTLLDGGEGSRSGGRGQRGHGCSSDGSSSLMFQIDAAGAEPRRPVVGGFSAVICKYESVMDIRRGEVRGGEEGGVLFVFWARLKMAGSEDLQGFCSQHLVNISEALMVY